MANRLIHENSPYLVQHANNPVDWYPWGPEALEKARQGDLPIFLSIGYAACHWCHVMAHESFEDEGIAAILNEHFVSIKVDREERPDLDSIYMSAVVAISGGGGWPMSVFLTPEGAPFFGGTYFPPTQRYNLPAFRDLLLTIAHLWKDDREKLLASTDELRTHLAQSQAGGLFARELDAATLDEAVMRLSQSYDWMHGGWGQAPKFPQPMVIEFLLARATRGDRMARDVAEHALQAMARGGMYDVIGGGFARYSTDNEWLTPHFEKMLYDNAQLARVYLHAYLITGKKTYQRVCIQTLDFMAREMRPPIEGQGRGSFFSSLDADSEGKEGKFYLWHLDEIQKILATAELEGETPGEGATIKWLDFFLKAYPISEKGNFESRNILQRGASDEELARQFQIGIDEALKILDQIHAALYAARSQRIWPGIDDKALTGWNALALIVFAEAARYLDRPDYLQIARENAEFLLENLIQDGMLLRSWRNGHARHPAYLEDYAGLILGLLALYQSDPARQWFIEARALAEIMLTHFSDPNGGFFDTRDDQEALIVRPKDIQDNATPSGNALAALALLQLSVYTGNTGWRETAEVAISSVQRLASQYPTAFGKWLSAVDFCLHPTAEIAILGDLDSPEFRSLAGVVREQFRPYALAALSEFPPAAGSPELLTDRSLINGQPTAYVCRNFTCQRPTTDPEVLREQLRRTWEE